VGWLLPMWALNGRYCGPHEAFRMRVAVRRRRAGVADAANCEPELSQLVRMWTDTSNAMS